MAKKSQYDDDDDDERENSQKHLQIKDLPVLPTQPFDTGKFLPIVQESAISN